MNKEDIQIQQALDSIGSLGQKAGKLTNATGKFLRRKAYLIFSVVAFGFITLITSFCHSVFKSGSSKNDSKTL